MYNSAVGARTLLVRALSAIMEAITVTLTILLGTLTMVPEESATWQEVYANHVSYGHIVPGLSAEVYLATWPRYQGERFQLWCPSGLILDALAIDVAAKRDFAYLESIDFAADIFGRDNWQRCAIPGQTAQVRLTQVRQLKHTIH